MRAVLALVAGGPGRVCTTAAFAVTCAFLLAGHGGELLVAAWFAFLFAVSFVLLFILLTIAAATIGVSGEAPVAAPKEADHG